MIRVNDILILPYNKYLQNVLSQDLLRKFTKMNIHQYKLNLTHRFVCTILVVLVLSLQSRVVSTIKKFFASYKQKKTPQYSVVSLCFVCGSTGTIVCEACMSTIFCVECDTTYHRNPLRRHHKREVSNKLKQQLAIEDIFYQKINHKLQNIFI